MPNPFKALHLLASGFILGCSLIATAHATDCTLSVMTRGPVYEYKAATQAALKAVQEHGYVLKKDPAESSYVLYLDSRIPESEESSFANGFISSNPAVIELTLIRKGDDVPNAWLNGSTPETVEWKSVWVGGGAVFSAANREKAWARRVRKAILELPKCGVS